MFSVFLCALYMTFPVNVIIDGRLPYAQAGIFHLPVYVSWSNYKTY